MGGWAKGMPMKDSTFGRGEKPWRHPEEVLMMGGEQEEEWQVAVASRGETRRREIVNFIVRDRGE